ncbi:thioredoxin [Rhodotorula taiwanensis]|uniref:Thioredoxin n=1 Tax=Rhodotorula taiwanensis TaxID=741276 RepID=A0A2S5BHQ6_9BASI|nr:thioredoxin [Rhodotorula taiwanensis]
MALVFPATAWHAEEQLSLAKAALLFADCLSSSARRSLLAYIDAFSLFSHFDSTAPTPPRITMPVIEANNVTEWNTALRAAKAAGRTVIVDAYATWCGPCKAIAPVFDKLASTVDWVTFVRFDVDKCPSIAQAKKITAMPTFLAIRNGETVETLKGADPAALNRLVYTHAGPNPPIAPLSPEAEALKEEGNTFFKGGEFESARDKYSEAISLAPESFVLLGNRAFAILRSASPDFEAALADADEAVRIAPTWAKGHVRRGEALQGLGRKDEAARAFEEAIKHGTPQVKKEASEKLEKVRS